LGFSPECVSVSTVPWEDVMKYSGGVTCKNFPLGHGAMAKSIGVRRKYANL